MMKIDKPILFTKKDFLSQSPIFTNVAVCSTPYSPKTTLSDLHIHDFIEFSVVIAGTGIHKIWNKTFECKKGDVFIFNTGVPHCYFGASAKEYPTVLNVLFDQNLITDSNSSDDFCYGVFKNNSMLAHKRFSLDQLKTIIDICSKIKDELENKDCYWQESSKSLLKNLLIFCSRALNLDTTSSINGNVFGEEIVSSAIKLTLENYFKQDFTLEKLSSALFVSKAHLSRLLFRACGEHFADYVRNLRIKRAATLLTTTTLSNQEIVTACGLKDVPTFYKSFKNAYGVTPKQYRKNSI